MNVALLLLHLWTWFVTHLAKGLESCAIQLVANTTVSSPTHKGFNSYATEARETKHVFGERRYNNHIQNRMRQEPKQKKEAKDNPGLRFCSEYIPGVIFRVDRLHQSKLLWVNFIWTVGMLDILSPTLNTSSCACLSWFWFWYPCHQYLEWLRRFSPQNMESVALQTALNDAFLTTKNNKKLFNV